MLSTKITTGVLDHCDFQTLACFLSCPLDFFVVSARSSASSSTDAEPQSGSSSSEPGSGSETTTSNRYEQYGSLEYETTTT